MPQVIYFAVVQVIYSAIDRWRDWRYLLVEVVGQILFVLVALAVLPRIVSGVGQGATIGMTFWLAALIVRVCARRHPTEAAPLGEKTHEHMVPIGLIDFCWVGIMGATLSFITFSKAVSPFSDPLPAPGLPAEYYQAVAENSRFLLGHTVDGFFALGGVLTACMAILWAGEIWRGNRHEHRRSYKRTTLAAAKMVFAFFLTSLAVFIWLAWPLYRHMFAASSRLGE